MTPRSLAARIRLDLAALARLADHGNPDERQQAARLLDALLTPAREHGRTQALADLAERATDEAARLLQLARQARERFDSGGEYQRQAWEVGAAGEFVARNGDAGEAVEGWAVEVVGERVDADAAGWW